MRVRHFFMVGGGDGGGSKTGTSISCVDDWMENDGNVTA